MSALRRLPDGLCPRCGRGFRVDDHPRQVYCSWSCRWSRSIEDRLWEGVAKGEGCWEWRRPYGELMIRGRRVMVHRLAYELSYGPIPADLYVCHHCDNPKCIRPDHLFIGTNQDNQLDALAKGRLPIGERNARAKLRDAQVRVIRGRLAGGDGPTRIAAEYGVSRPAIQAIKAGRNWRSVS